MSTWSIGAARKLQKLWHQLLACNAIKLLRAWIGGGPGEYASHCIRHVRLPVRSLPALAEVQSIIMSPHSNTGVNGLRQRGWSRASVGEPKWREAAGNPACRVPLHPDKWLSSRF